MRPYQEMVPGTSIKWKSSLNNEWKSGVIISKLPTRRHCFRVGASLKSNVTFTVLPKNIVPYEKLASDEQIVQFGKDNAKALKDMIYKACISLISGGSFLPKKDGSDGNLTIDFDTNVSIYGGAITIDPASYDQQLLGKFVEKPCWAITVWHEIPATRDDPPDRQDKHIGNAVNNGQAAKLAVQTLFNLLAEWHWQSEDDMRLAEEWEKSEKAEAEVAYCPICASHGYQ